MSTPEQPDDEERTLIRPPSSRARPPAPAATGAAAPTPGPGLPRAAGPPPQLGHTLPVGTRLRDYEITGLIGEGGFGIVYLAWDHSLQRKVAVKEYMPASMASRVNGSSAIVVKSERHLDTFKAGLKSFVNEARLLARFDHPSLVKVYRFWEENGTAYMVMPFYEGPTLKAALAELGHVPSEAELRAWLAPLLDALAVMHAAQCFHRDIAPDNILLTAAGPLLLDFGAARRVIGGMTHALTVVLKPGYAPIEQYGDVASMTQGAWTDLYALACVVYYAITGKTAMSSVERLMDDRLEPLSALAAGRYSTAFLRAIDAALAVKPQDRPQDDAQFRALLDADLPAGPVPAPRSGFGALSHEPIARSESRPYSTVPGTLTPVLATQLLDRTPTAPPPTAPGTLGDARSVTLSPLEPAPSLGPASRPASAARLDAGRPASAGVAPAHRARRFAAWAIGGVVLAVAFGAVWVWVLPQRGGPAGAGAASAVGMPVAGPASASAAPAPVEPAVVAPAPAAPGALTPAPVEPRVTPPVEPRVTTPVEPRRAAAPAPAEGPPIVARPAPREPAPAASLPAPRVRREAAPPRPETAAAPRPAPAPRAEVGARCSDILQKASLEPLTADEAAYLRRECR